MIEAIYKSIYTIWFHFYKMQNNLQWKKADQCLSVDEGGNWDYFKGAQEIFRVWWKCSLSWLEWWFHRFIWLSKTNELNNLNRKFIVSYFLSKMIRKKWTKSISNFETEFFDLFLFLFCLSRQCLSFMKYPLIVFE